MSPSENTPLADASTGDAPGAGISLPAAAAPDVAVPARWRPLWVALAWTAVALYVFLLGFFPLRSSHDEWWHLKTGQWIVENGMRLPEKDVFTYTAADYKWDNHEWLTEVAMYGLWRWGEDRDVGGWRLVILVKALLLVAAYLLLGRFAAQRAGGGAAGLAIGIFVAVLAADVGRRMFWPRPPIVSNLFLVFYLYVLWLHRSGRLRTPWLLVLPFLMPLWANLHGGFLLGGVVVAAYAGGEAMEWGGGRVLARRSPETMRPQWVRAWTYVGLGVLCGLASLCNPFGYRVYLLTSRVMRDRTLVSLLGELLPPDFRFTWAFAFLAMFLAAGMAALLAATLERGRKCQDGRPGSRSLVLAAFFAVAALAGLGWAVSHFSHAREAASEGSPEYQCCAAYAVAVLGLASVVGCLVAAWWARRRGPIGPLESSGAERAVPSSGGSAFVVPALAGNCPDATVPEEESDGGFPAEAGTTNATVPQGGGSEAMRWGVAWPPLADLLIAAFFFSQALQHVRHLILFGIGAAPLAAWLLARAHEALGDAGRRRLRFALGALSAVIVLWVLCLPGEAFWLARLGRGGLGLSQLARNLQLWRGQEYNRLDYPIEAADFLLQARIPSDPAARLPGRLFNRNNNSGYLIWALSPEHYRLFTDSRFDIFGGDFLSDEMSVVGVWTSDELLEYYRKAERPRPGLRDWRTVIADWGINLLLVEKGEKVHGYLLRQCFQDWLTANAPAAMARSFAQGDGSLDARSLAWLSEFQTGAARRPEAPASEWALVHADAGFAVWLRRAPGHEPWTDRYEDWTRTVREFLRVAGPSGATAPGSGGHP